MSDYQDFKRFRDKVAEWKAMLEGRSNTQSSSTYTQDGIVRLIGDMDLAIDGMNIAMGRVADDGGHPVDINALMNYINNFDVVMAFIHAHVNGNELPVTPGDAVGYMSTTSMEVNPTIDAAAVYLIEHGVDEKDCNEMLDLLSKNLNIGGNPSSGKGDDDTFNSDFDDDGGAGGGVYNAMIGAYNPSGIYKTDPFSKLVTEPAIPGLELIDFSLFGFVTV